MHRLIYMLLFFM